MTTDLLQGELVRLAMQDPEVLAEAYARWSANSAYLRLGNSGIAIPASQRAAQSFLTKIMQSNSNYFFGILTLSDGKLIGDVALDGVRWNTGESFVGIGIGETDEWDKGYGTDAMRVILRYAFLELNLRRVSLNVFAYNPRAIHSYEKIGFVHEGRERGVLKREGERSDLVYMGILREEWEEMYGTFNYTRNN